MTSSCNQAMSEAAAFYHTGTAADCFIYIIQHTLSVHGVWRAWDTPYVSNGRSYSTRTGGGCERSIREAAKPDDVVRTGTVGHMGLVL